MFFSACSRVSSGWRCVRDTRCSGWTRRRWPTVVVSEEFSQSSSCEWRRAGANQVPPRLRFDISYYILGIQVQTSNSWQDLRLFVIIWCLINTEGKIHPTPGNTSVAAVGEVSVQRCEETFWVHTELVFLSFRSNLSFPSYQTLVFIVSRLCVSWFQDLKFISPILSPFQYFYCFWFVSLTLVFLRWS